MALTMDEIAGKVENHKHYLSRDVDLWRDCCAVFEDHVEEYDYT